MHSVKAFWTHARAQISDDWRFVWVVRSLTRRRGREASAPAEYLADASEDVVYRRTIAVAIQHRRQHAEKSTIRERAARVLTSQDVAEDRVAVRDRGLMGECRRIFDVTLVTSAGQRPEERVEAASRMAESALLDLRVALRFSNRSRVKSCRSK